MHIENTLHASSIQRIICYFLCHALFQTLERSYLLKINGKIAERPQHMLMRVAVGIHGDDIDSAIEVYLWKTYNMFRKQSLF